jgi:hypothetical protein
VNPALLLELAVHHEFFVDGICRSLVFMADPETSAEIARRRLVLRKLPGILRLYATGDSLPGDRMECRFAAHSTDPLFELRTECPTARDGLALRYGDDRLLDDGSTMEPRIETAPVSEPGRPVRLVVEHAIPGTGNRTSDDGPGFPSLRIRFGARKVFWKYHLLGEFAQRRVEIVDLDAAEDPIRFSALATPGPAGSASWISDREIPAREIAPQRLQLRDTETGRVLVKRLPNPDFRTFGREPLRSGGNALVVEAFIHP